MFAWFATPLSGAADVLEPYYGVWLGPGGGGARTLDVAIWRSGSGFTINWREPRPRATLRMKIRFTAGTGAGVFVASATDPPLGRQQSYRATVQNGRLTVHFHDATDGRSARYEYRISGSGLTLKYTLVRDGRAYESTSWTLHRAKVVM